MKIGRVKKTPEAGFDLTPMVDVVMLLVIFFVLSSQFAQAVRKALSLPTEAGEAPGVMKPETLIVDIERDGTMSSGGQRLDREGLLATVRTQIRLAGAPEAVDLVVRADREGPAVHLNRVAIDLASLGVRSWKLATAGEGVTGRDGGER